MFKTLFKKIIPRRTVEKTEKMAREVEKIGEKNGKRSSFRGDIHK